MGKASTKKRVQRAGGARKMAMRGKRRPYGFYALIGVLLVAGIGGIGFGMSTFEDAQGTIADVYFAGLAV